MTFTEAQNFCTSHKFTAFQVYAEPARLIVPDSIHTTPHRVELDMYADGYDVHRVGKAAIYRYGELVTTITTDECDECGGPCDGAHAKVFSVHTLLDMTFDEAKKHCKSHNLPLFNGSSCRQTCESRRSPQRGEPDLPTSLAGWKEHSRDLAMSGDSDSLAIASYLQYPVRFGEQGIHDYVATRKTGRRSLSDTLDRVEVITLNDRVYSADFYRNGMLVDSLRGNYLAPARETRVKELVNVILKNEKSIVDEVIRQMDAKRVGKIVEVLSTQDPDVVREILKCLKNAQ
jgi:hypothetical protein